MSQPNNEKTELVLKFIENIGDKIFPSNDMTWFERLLLGLVKHSGFDIKVLTVLDKSAHKNYLYVIFALSVIEKLSYTWIMSKLVSGFFGLFGVVV